MTDPLSPSLAVHPRAPLADAPPRVKRFVLASLALIAAAGVVGTALLPSLSVRRPYWLLAIAPNYLGLVATRVDFAPAVLLVAFRRLFGLCVYYGLGGIYGPEVVSRLGAKSPRSQAALGWIEARFARWSLAVMLVSPTVPVALVAGSAGVPFRRFVLATLLGQLVATSVLYRFGILIGAFTSRILGFLGEHLVESSVVFLLAAVLQRLVARARADRAKRLTNP